MINLFKRTPLWGRIACVINIFLLITTISLCVHYKSEYKKLEATNVELNNTIISQYTAIEDLKSELEIKTLEIEKLNNEIAQLKTTLTNSGVNAGKFRLTAYCNCSKCCGKWAGGPTASGVMPKTKRTIAVDPKVIPLGSKVIIDEHTYIAEDTGSAIKGNRIDVYFDNHQEAMAFGVKYKDVKVIK